MKKDGLITITGVLPDDPVLSNFNSHEVCYFKIIDSSIDVGSISDSELRDLTYHVYETGNHVQASMKYLGKGSLCIVEGHFGYAKSVDSNGNTYNKKCIRATKVEFRSYSEKMVQEFNQSLFDHFANK